MYTSIWEQVGQVGVCIFTATADPRPRIPVRNCRSRPGGAELPSRRKRVNSLFTHLSIAPLRYSTATAPAHRSTPTTLLDNCIWAERPCRPKQHHPLNDQSRVKGDLNYLGFDSRQFAFCQSSRQHLVLPMGPSRANDLHRVASSCFSLSSISLDTKPPIYL